jgi:hypothetical protein
LGDFLPIGQLFALGSFLKISKDPEFWPTFYYGKSFAPILTKNGLGYILGEIFANSSGHSV